VVNPEDPNGNVQLSYLRAREEHDWNLAESLFQSGDPFEGEVIGFNKGGLIVPMGRLRGFIPASQVSVLRRMDATGSTPEQRWGAMVGDQVQVRVIEVDRERRRLILSERSALQETRESLKDRLLDELNEGDVRTGRVTSLAEFGAFVNIEGADGLVHLSEISWERIEHPREILKVGQEVQVKVIAVDHDRKRIGLSIRQLQEDPWIKKVGDIKEGQLVEGTITHLTKFGAFARLSEDLEGLVHISELSEQRVGHPKEIVREDDVVTLRVIKIDPERRRIGLSLRKVDSPAYADLDWKTTLAEVVAEQHDDEQSEESPLPEPQDEVEQFAPLPDTAVEDQVSVDLEEPALQSQEDDLSEEPVSEQEDEPAPEAFEEETAVEPSASEEEIPDSSVDGLPDEPVANQEIETGPDSLEEDTVDQPDSNEEEQPGSSSEGLPDEPVAKQEKETGPDSLEKDPVDEPDSNEGEQPASSAEGLSDEPVAKQEKETSPDSLEEDTVDEPKLK
jgi:small subunit ribosomal protein S1